MTAMKLIGLIILFLFGSGLIVVGLQAEHVLLMLWVVWMRLGLIVAGVVLALCAFAVALLVIFERTK